MTLLRRFRSPLIALVAVVFSASIALAGQPAAKGASGLANAGTHAGKTLPVQGSEPSTDQNEASETETDDQGDTSGSSDATSCNVDLTGDLSSFTHGQVVCTAAQQATPNGYANHGAWVSHWAKMNHGADAAATGKSHKPSH